MAAKKKTESFPFPFFQHGTWPAKDDIDGICFDIVFREPLSPDQRKKAETGLPKGLDEVVWSEGVGAVLSVSRYGLSIGEAYGGGPGTSRLTGKQIKAFCSDLDEWLTELNKKHPLLLTIGSGTKDDKWHQWSVRQFPDVILPVFEHFFAPPQPPRPERITDLIDRPESHMAAVLGRALQNYFAHRAEGTPVSHDELKRFFAAMESATGFNYNADGAFTYLKRCYAQSGNPSGPS